MGIDVNGWIEVDFGGWWDGVVRLGSIPDRNYDLFSCLFGVADYAQFVPIAARRGLPADISEAASDDYLTWDVAFGETWISWPEIQTIDWEESALDTRPHAYRRDAAGRLVCESKSVMRSDHPLEEGATWYEGDRVYRIERITRRSVLGDDRGWPVLMRLIDVLASEYGGDRVRLVVWFDR